MIDQEMIPRVMRSPRGIDIELTARCNLRCAYCYFFGNDAVEYRDVSTEEWLQFFEECGRLGVMSLTLAGGEPFMRKDMRTLLAGIVQNRMRFSLLSNGGLIDDGIAAFIAETGRCDSIQISMDGSTAAVHDTYRGKGSFAGAVRGIRTLQRHNIPISVRVTIHSRNVHDLENIARFLLEDLGLSSFSTNAVGYLGTCRHNADSVLLTTAQRVEAMQTLLRLSEKYDGRISANAGPLAEARMWQEMEEARLQRTPPLAQRGHLSGCGCHWNSIAVRADGSIVTCSMLPHMVLGRINQDSLQHVWLNNAQLHGMRKRQTISLMDFEACTGCLYLDYCTGNCPGLAYTLTGQVHHPSPDACLRRFLADGGTIPGFESTSNGRDAGPVRARMQV